MAVILALFSIPRTATYDLPQENEVITATSTPTVQKDLNSEIKRLAAKYSVDESKARKIIKCESNFKPYAQRLNTNKTTDYSYWQINNYWWEEEMHKLGWDIKDPEDNLEAGFYLYSKYGDKLWNWSKYCWNK